MAGVDGYTKLMLHMDDSDFKDEVGHAVVNNGVTFDTITKKFGDGCANFTLAGYMTVANSTDWSFGTGDFTIDWWEYRTSSTNDTQPIISKEKYGFIFGYRSKSSMTDKILSFMSSNGTSWDIASAVAMGNFITNQWVHRAICRKNNTFYFFENGSIYTTITSTASIYNSTSALSIGIYDNQTTNTFYGYMDELRISKGIARWTSNFIPPTAPYGMDKFLVQQANNYYYINNHYLNLGTPIDNIQLDDWFKKYSYQDISVLISPLTTKKVPTTVEENIVYKSFNIDLNDVIGSDIILVEEQGKKYIQYGCGDYKIIDKIKENDDGRFDLVMKSI